MSESLGAEESSLSREPVTKLTSNDKVEITLHGFNENARILADYTKATILIGGVDVSGLVKSFSLHADGYDRTPRLYLEVMSFGEVKISIEDGETLIHVNTEEH